MSEIAAEFFVEVDGITVDPAILGRSMTVIRKGNRARIDFPEESGSFSFMTVAMARGAEPLDPRDAVPTHAVVDRTESLATVRIVRIVVNLTSDLSVAKDQSPSQRAQYENLLRDLAEQAVDLAEELCAQLNLSVGQHWIAPRGILPRVINMVSLIDLDASEPFDTMIGPAGMLRIVGEETVLSAVNFDRVAEGLKSGPPAADEIMLAEARHLVHQGFPVAPERSVLLAAIGLELRTKRLLRLLAGTPQQLASLDLLLDNPRDWSMSVHGLFLKALPVFASAGPDGLGQAHRDLAKRVQRLFQGRNALAHSGSEVSAEDASLHVQTAADAFSFLESLERSRIVERSAIATDGGRGARGAGHPIEPASGEASGDDYRD